MHRLTDRSLRYLRVFVVVFPVSVAVVWGYVSYRSMLDAAVEGAQRNADLLREYTLRLIQTQFILLDAAEAFIAETPPDELKSREVHAFLRTVESSQAMTFGLAMIGADGTFIASSRSYPVRGRVGEREYLTRHKTGEGLFIDRLILEPGGQDALVVTKRLAGEPFRGLLASSVDVRAVTEFLARIASGDDSAASLFREDGMLLARNAPGAPVRLAPDQPIFAATRDRDSGWFETRARADGVTRIYAFSRVGDLPLFANFGLSKQALVSAWARDLAIPVLFLIALAVALFIAVQATQRRIVAERGRMKAEVDQIRLKEAETAATLKDAMMREMNHRVKNSLQSVQALIRVRQGGRSDPFAEEMGQRVHAIAEIHDLLYTSDDQIHIDLAEFIARLCSNDSLFPPERGIRADCDLEPVPIAFSQATPVALIVVELVTNAIKHAFPGRREGRVSIRLRRHGDTAELDLSDDGIGLGGTARRSGLRLIDRMVEQLGGTLETVSGAGTRFRLTFPLPAKT